MGKNLIHPETEEYLLSFVLVKAKSSEDGMKVLHRFL